MRLIDANALCAACSFKTTSGECIMPYCKVRTLDGVELVLCKDCIHKRRYHYKPPVCYCLFYERVKSESGFCDMGVMKDNDST